MSHETPLGMVDQSALRSNQAVIIGALLAAFVLDSTILAALVAVSMLVGALSRTQAFRWVYSGILLPLRVVRPDPVPDHPTPHRFAQGLGGGFLAVACFALALAAPAVGWGLVWLVILLAAVNVFLGFCAGCFVYYWLARFRVPGFTHSPPPDTFPGLRPPRV